MWPKGHNIIKSIFLVISLVIVKKSHLGQLRIYIPVWKSVKPKMEACQNIHGDG